MSAVDRDAIWAHIGELSAEILELEIEQIQIAFFDGNREERLGEMIAEAKAELALNLSLVWESSAQ